MRSKELSALRQVHIDIGGNRVVAWEARNPGYHVLGRWTDPKALLRRIYEIEHPEEEVLEGPGRQWQATWRGGFSSRGRPRKTGRESVRRGASSAAA